MTYPAPRTYSPNPGSSSPQSHPRALGALLIAGLVCTGLMAGLFWGFSIAVMPGLARANDRTFVNAMRQINAAIQNGTFGLVFLGAMALPVAAAVLAWRQGQRTTAWWIAGGLGLYLVAILITMGIDIPLNNKLADADVSNAHKLAQARSDFENVWVATNDVRSVLCLAATAVLGVATVRHGRGR